MTKSRDLKLLIRERMQKTGQSYTTARRHVETMSSGAQENGPPPAATDQQVEENGPPPLVRDEIKGWRRVSEKGMPEDYEVKVDHTQGHRSSSSALIRSRRDTAVDSSTKLMQWFLAHEYRGCRVRLSAWIKSEGLTGSCRLWMEIDENTRLLIVATSEPVTGAAEWTRREVVLEVDQEATLVLIAILLDGAGAAWVADIAIETVGKDVPTTTLGRDLPVQPRNLNLLE
jgi:AraC family transcriptional regulator